MKFYFVSPEYLKCLQKVDSNVMLIKDEYIREKFVFGAVTVINNFKYYVPVSSIKPHQLIDKNTLAPEYVTCSFPIINHQITGYHISAILRFNYMFPVPDCALTQLNIHRLPPNHKNLVQKQYSSLIKKTLEINTFATDIYDSVITGTNTFKKYCNFLNLEVVHNEWLENSENTEMVKQKIRL